MRDTPWEFFVNGVRTRLFLTLGHFGRRTAAIFCQQPATYASFAEAARYGDHHRKCSEVPMADDKLSKYKAKRDFKLTKEPSGAAKLNALRDDKPASEVEAEKPADPETADIPEPQKEVKAPSRGRTAAKVNVMGVVDLQCGQASLARCQRWQTGHKTGPRRIL
jgi:hypothetical protein